MCDTRVLKALLHVTVMRMCYFQRRGRFVICDLVVAVYLKMKICVRHDDYDDDDFGSDDVGDYDDDGYDDDDDVDDDGDDDEEKKKKPK